jgi:hypothetical protein
MKKVKLTTEMLNSMLYRKKHYPERPNICMIKDGVVENFYYPDWSDVQYFEVELTAMLPGCYIIKYPKEHNGFAIEKEHVMPYNDFTIDDGVFE